MTHIPARAASRLLDSVAFLNAHFGQVLNGHITLNFEQLGVNDQRAAKQALSDMNERLARCIQSVNKRFSMESGYYYVYAHERCLQHGWHVHELIAAPRGLLPSIKPWLNSWIAARFGEAAIRRGAVKFRPLGGKTADDQVLLQAKLVRYILKSVDDTTAFDRNGQLMPVADMIGIIRRQVSEPLPIKRLTGVSQNIALRAQLKANYSLNPHWEDLLSIRNLWAYQDRLPPSRELTQQLLSLDE